MGISNATIPITSMAHSALTGVTTAQHHASPAPESSTNDAIARYDGAAGALQDYTSLAPTISDAGIIALTSGALQWPSTAIPSADANTLDDYEEGTFTPQLADNSNDGTGEGQAYGAQVGAYTRVGNRVAFNLFLVGSTVGAGLTGGQQCRILGLPFASEGTASNIQAVSVGYASTMLLGTAGFNVSARLNPSEAFVRLDLWDATTGTSALLIQELANGYEIGVSGVYEV